VHPRTEENNGIRGSVWDPRICLGSVHT